MHHQTSSEISIADQPMSRRGLLRAGGLTVTMAALVAACVDQPGEKNPARVGEAAVPTPLPDAVVTDGVLLRTATSIHYSIIDSHNATKKLGNAVVRNRWKRLLRGEAWTTSALS